MRGYARLALTAALIGLPLLGLLIFVQYQRVTVNSGAWPREAAIGLGVVLITAMVVVLGVASVAVPASRAAKSLRESKPVVFVNRREAELVNWIGSLDRPGGMPKRLPLLFPISADESGLVLWDTRTPPRPQLEVGWAEIGGISRSTMPLYSAFEVPALFVNFVRPPGSRPVTFVPGFAPTGGVLPLGEVGIDRLVDALDKARRASRP